MLSTILKHSVSIKTLLINVQPICKITSKYLSQDKNVFPIILTVRTFLASTHTRLSDGLVQSARLFKPRKLSQNLLVRHQQTITLDLNTNIKNNVILYKNENQKYMRMLHLFAIIQLFGWSLVTFFTYTPSFFEIFSSDIRLQEYINKHVFKLSFFIISILIGPLTYAVFYIVSGRTIRYIILNKGGKNVTFITSNFWNRKSNIQVPVNTVKCACQRSNNVSTIPFKLKGRSFYYLIETKGTFVNPELFDHTLGFTHFKKL